LPAFNKAVRISLIWSAILAGILFIGFMLLGPALIDFMSTNTQVQTTAKEYLIWAALTGIFGVVAFQMDGVYIGATWSREMRNMMILSILAYLLAWWILTPIWGNHGLWLSLEIFLGFRGISLLSKLKSKRDIEFASQ
jgi:MATE family multidrug resistance protein